MNDQSENSGSVVRSDQAAFIVDAAGRISLVLPSKDLDGPVLPAHRLLLAIALRVDDPDWVEEMLSGDWDRKCKLGFL